MRILVVEDDSDIARAVAAQLTQARYVVDVAADGHRGLDLLLRNVYDLGILDVVLPGHDGLEICRIAREESIATPLLMLSARDSVEDRIRGLHAGADDYLIKPFSADELVARLHALLRRSERAPELRVARLANATIDPLTRSVRIDDAPIALGTTEFRLFEYFMRNRGIRLTREQILRAVWDYDFDGSSNIVDVYVSQLRRKLRKAGAKVAIVTAWGIGYALDEVRSSAARSHD